MAFFRPLSLLFALTALTLPAPGQGVPDRVYTAEKIPEAFDRAERERLPVCVLQMGGVDPKVETAKQERMRKEAMEQMSAECVVIATWGREKGYLEFTSLQLRTKEASMEDGYLSAILIDPWQEVKLGLVTVNSWDGGDVGKHFAGFSKKVSELPKKAKEWKAANAPKPEQWTDVKGRSMTATVLAWDGKTASFRLPNGKTAKLDAAALSEETAGRLSKVFRPKVPFVSASDAAALEAAVGQRVCVVGRLERATQSGWPSDMETPGVRYHLFSPLFAMKYDKAMRTQLEFRNTDSASNTRGRAYGLLEKEKVPGAGERYVIRVTDPRQFGPVAAPE